MEESWGCSSRRRKPGIVRWEDRPAQETADKYVYDPLDVRPAEVERQANPEYLHDQSGPLNLFGNGVVFHSAPFARDTEITGRLKFTVWMATDVPDTDFDVSVYEILPNGTSIALTDDSIRARFRDSLTEAKPLKAGEIVRYEFHTFQFFSRRIAKGSRPRLVLLCPNSTSVEKNYNSGGEVAEESGKSARKAHIITYGYRFCRARKKETIQPEKIKGASMRCGFTPG